MEITSEFCRICLKDAPMFNDSNFLQSFSIYKKDDNNLTFADKIHILTIIKIPRSIPLAKRICTRCSEDLNSAYELIKKCEQSDLILQKFIQKKSDCKEFLQIELNKLKCEEDSTDHVIEKEKNNSRGKKSSNNDRISTDCEKICVFYENSLSANCNNSSNDTETSDLNENEIKKHDLLMECLEDFTPLDEKCQSITTSRCPYKKMQLDDESSVTCDNDDDYKIEKESESSSDDWDNESRKKNNIKILSRKVIRIVLNKNITQNSIGVDNENGVTKGNLPSTKVKRQKPFSLEEDQSHQNDRKEENSASIRKAKKKKIIRLISTHERKKKNRKGARLSQNNSIVCEICGKIYHRYDMLRGHMKWHENNDQDFLCDICGKGFELPDYLKSHRKFHFNRPCPFKCETCPAAFYQQSKLKEHMKTRHSDERLKCPQCDITVKHRASLKRHIFKHTEIKPFACIDCSKEFRNMANLKQHLDSKFHASKEIQPMVRIKGVTEQYEPRLPKKRKLFVVESNSNCEQQI